MRKRVRDAPEHSRLVSTPRIHTIDLLYLDNPETIAAYLVEGPESPVLIETGPESTLPALTRGLKEIGLEPRDIPNVLVTHIHLDHAGALGWWAEQGADVWVHHRGAPHMIDPSLLWASASRIYGKDMERFWKGITPAPRERVHAVSPGETIAVGGLEIVPIDTPGHAGHHFAYRVGDIAFVGDVTGIRVPGLPFVDLPMPPPEFKLELWLESLDRLESENLGAIYPTHFDRVEDVAGQLDAARSGLRAEVDFIAKKVDEGLERDAIVAEFDTFNRARASASGLSDEEVDRFKTASPVYMSVDGVLRYLKKKADR